ncbi:hypothetical protein BV25DRAFT_767979 [Artomyces pyxidatus]|uniref:Uncharacterized protein n=1 Tax=Artomyces pyxidatus TaxID=48021 RepID=A0ACB8SZK1_9AGAM|nr:hypothetical protein BV25DRAFT_767979 [Artomyces pyxidatus]
MDSSTYVILTLMEWERLAIVPRLPWHPQNAIHRGIIDRMFCVLCGQCRGSRSTSVSRSRGGAHARAVPRLLEPQRALALSTPRAPRPFCLALCALISAFPSPLDPRLSSRCSFWPWPSCGNCPLSRKPFHCQRRPQSTYGLRVAHNNAACGRGTQTRSGGTQTAERL